MKIKFTSNGVNYEVAVEAVRSISLWGISVYVYLLNGKEYDVTGEIRFCT